MPLETLFFDNDSGHIGWKEHVWFLQCIVSLPNLPVLVRLSDVDDSPSTMEQSVVPRKHCSIAG
jgi:hypothetical protein